ncbi:SDR family NAD(P)-dependent oxidoreductase [Oceanobacter mangrovi]|uniref:SDR family NAD(P)-dependent oxidoreductase n=1 Tax=Oceanobacter mangrovi TaxID=2862510 RepID=UPI001C8D5AEB|nr:SDR family NAD(P)-dependent oxidoreductase [Oceanobacter mangrovi]
MIDYQLKGKVAMITGAASGIGFAIAEKMAASGAALSLWDVSEDHLTSAIEKLKHYDVPMLAIVADVSDADAVAAGVERTVAELGRLDIGVNNAGIGGPAAKSAEYPIDGWNKVININLNGVFYCQRAQLQTMVKQGSGSIVNMASILGQVGIAMSPAYVAAKHGVVGMTKSAALEHAADGIRLNSVGPGFIHTPLVDETLDKETQDYLATQHALNRMGTPAEVAELVCWLASDAASFVTGTYYAVDGGYLAK